MSSSNLTSLEEDVLAWLAAEPLGADAEGVLRSKASFITWSMLAPCNNEPEGSIKNPKISILCITCMLCVRPCMRVVMKKCIS